jgi:hypothetical protein
MGPQQWLNLLNRLGHPKKTKWHVRIMERYRHGAGVVTSLARSLRGGPLKNARLVAFDGARDLSPSHSAGGNRCPPTDDVARGGLSATVAATCADAPDAGRAVVWAVPSQPRGGPGRLSGGAGPAADGGASRAGLADGVCAAGGRPSGAVSHLWAAARVHQCDPARGCATAYTGWGARGMKPTHARWPGGGGRSGGWCVWRWPSGVPARAGTWSEGLSGPGLHPAAPQGRLAGPVAGGMAWG